jgi:hypothetical protein
MAIHQRGSEQSLKSAGPTLSFRNPSEARRNRVARLSFSQFPALRHRVLLALVVIAAASSFLTGCSSTNGSMITPTPIITLSETQAPPAMLAVGGTASVSAMVSNDVANAGVDWVSVCPNAPNCGTFNPPHTTSGGVSIFTAPLNVPSGNKVSVTALSSTDHSKSSATQITITSTVTEVDITLPPPATFPSGGSVSVAAVVMGDPSNAGIDWKATCGLLDCTSGFVSAHSAAGVPNVFVVPIPSFAFPDIVGSTVVFTAFATADHNFKAIASFTVTQQISIKITQAPPSSLLVNATASMIAVVSNDPTNAGVTWTVVSCDAAPCGTISPLHTASGEATVYTAPPTPVDHVIIQAAATASPTGAPVVEITITVPISVAITQGAANNSIVKDATAPLIATVTADSSDAGVDWTVTCGSAGACGSFAPAHTASGTATTFTAPAAVPTGNTVTVTATSTADTSKSASETITVTAGVQPNSLLSGQFVFSLHANNSGNGPYAMGGVITGDGAGTITKGNFDLADASGNASPASAVSVLAPSTYSLGSDGRGQIQLTINTANLNGTFGVNGSGAITLSVTFITPNHALLTETDSFGSGTGTLDLQNAADLAAFQNNTKSLGGIYTLNVAGSRSRASQTQYFVAGGLAFRSSGISVTEINFVADQSDGGVITSSPSHTANHTFSNATADQNGELQLDSVALGLPTLFNFNAWLIDASHFVITDWRDSFSGMPPVIVIGNMTAQPATPTITRSFVFTETGATTAAQPQVAGGVIACGGTGVLDVVPLGGAATLNQPITSTCGAPSGGRAVISIAGAGSTGITKFAAYPTVDRSLQLIELDGGATGPTGAGVALQQTSSTITAAAIHGKYGGEYSERTGLGTETFGGQVILDGVSAVSGIVDVDSFNATATPPAGAPSLGATLSGAFVANANGRFPMTFTIAPAAGQATPEFSTINAACYIMDANTCLLIGLDNTAPGTGILQIQKTGL